MNLLLLGAGLEHELGGVLPERALCQLAEMAAVDLRRADAQHQLQQRTARLVEAVDQPRRGAGGG